MLALRINYGLFISAQVVSGKQKHADTGAGVTILIEEFFYYGTCLTIKGKTSSSFATCFFFYPLSRNY